MKIRFIFQGLLICFYFLILSFLNTRNVFASNYFEEEFNGDWSDVSSWTVNQNGGSLTFSPNDLQFLSSNPDGFPYVASSQIVFPEGNLSVEWKFMYTSTSYNFGTGINISDNLPINRTTTSPGNNHYLFSSWVGGVGKISLNSSVCNSLSAGCITPPGAFFISNGSDFNQFNTVKIDYIDDVYYLYYNGELKFTSEETTRSPKYLWLGNPLDPGSSLLWSPFKVDYIRIRTLDSTELDVPFFSQNDPEWNGVDDEYDHASVWTNPDNAFPMNSTSMDTWGCAVTSSAMLLNFFGLDTTDTNPLDPGTLNDWLKTHGGYVEGGLSWISLTQLVRQTHPTADLILKNHSVDYADADIDVFTDQIDQEIPEIWWLAGDTNHWAESPSHFVIGRGYDDDSLLIHDPEELYTELASTYPVRRRMTYDIQPETPKHLGMMGVYSKPGLNMVVENLSGLKVGKDKNQLVYQDIADSSYDLMDVPYLPQLTLGSQITEAVVPNQQYQELLINHLENGIYFLFLHSVDPTDFDVSVQLLNSDNTATSSAVLQGTLTANQEKMYLINFTDSELNSIEEVHEPATFDSIKAFIETAASNGKIKPKIVSFVLLEKLKITEHFFDKEKMKLAKIALTTLIGIVKIFTPRFIEAQTSHDLNLMLQELRDSLG